MGREYRDRVGDGNGPDHGEAGGGVFVKEKYHEQDSR